MTTASPRAIGIRLYKITAREKHQRHDLTATMLRSTLHGLDNFFTKYAEKHSYSSSKSNEHKLWHISKKLKSENSIYGLISYGYYGITSKIIDIDTLNTEFDRDENHAEEIQLFFDIWHDPKNNYAVMALQSFGARSCIDLVHSAMKELFSELHPDHSLRIAKITPYDAAKLGDHSVKELVIIKNSHNSKLDNQIDCEYNLELHIVPPHGKTLGTLKKIQNAISTRRKNKVKFDKFSGDAAYANVLIGGNKHKVGILGISDSAGMIDITDAVEKSKGGHPKFNSIKEISSRLISDFALNIKTYDN